MSRVLTQHAFQGDFLTTEVSLEYKMTSQAQGPRGSFMVTGCDIVRRGLGIVDKAGMESEDEGNWNMGV